MKSLTIIGLIFLAPLISTAKVDVDLLDIPLKTDINLNPLYIKVSEAHSNIYRIKKGPICDLQKIKVMIIDTQLDSSVPALKNFFERPTGISFKESDHGTHVAGIIATRLVRSLGERAYSQVEFIHCQNSGIIKTESGYKSLTDSTELLNCMDKAIKMKVDVVNYSGGGTSFIQAEFDKIKELRKNKITLVVSAGNLNMEGSLYYPCGIKLDNIVCVGSVDRTSKKSEFSNYGSKISYWALGDRVTSYGVRDNLMEMTGTSQAAPQVTAYIVLQKLKASPQVLSKAKKEGMISDGKSLKTNAKSVTQNKISSLF